MATENRSLVVVRGSVRGTDPNYACLAHDTRAGRYCALEIDESAGRVANRHFFRSSEQAAVQDLMQHKRFNTVYVDGRVDQSLLDLRRPEHALDVDMSRFRRAKSDEEAQTMLSLARLNADQIRGNDVSASTYRRAASAHVTPYRAAHKKTVASGFVQDRGGLQSEGGLFSEVTEVTPRTQDWSDRLQRVYRGIKGVVDQMGAGVTEAHLNEVFQSHLAPTDYLYGGVVRNSGYEPDESQSCPLGVLQPHDVVSVGACVGDGRETAMIYRGVAVIHPTGPPTLSFDARYRSTPAAQPLEGSGTQSDALSDDEVKQMYQNRGLVDVVEDINNDTDETSLILTTPVVTQRLKDAITVAKFLYPLDIDPPNAITLDIKKRTEEYATALRKNDIVKHGFDEQSNSFDPNTWKDKGIEEITRDICYSDNVVKGLIFKLDEQSALYEAIEANVREQLDLSVASNGFDRAMEAVGELNAANQTLKSNREQHAELQKDLRLKEQDIHACTETIKVIKKRLETVGSGRYTNQFANLLHWLKQVVK